MRLYMQEEGRSGRVCGVVQLQPSRDLLLAEQRVKISVKHLSLGH